MNLKYQFIFNFFIFSYLFSMDNLINQNITYSPEGIQKVTKIIFENDSQKNIDKEYYFAQGLSHFCKEKNIAPFALIGYISNFGYSESDGLKEEITTKNFFFTATNFPKGAILTQVSRYYYEKSSFFSIVEYRLHSTITMTPEMKQFVKEMIEKGKLIFENHSVLSN